MIETILDGKSLELIDVHTVKMPNLPSSERDVESTDVPGRVHGSLTRKLGWKDAVFPISLTFYDLTNLQAKKRKLTSLVINSTKLAFSNDPQFYYLIKNGSLGEVTVDDLDAVATVEMSATIDPFQYQVTKSETHSATFDIVNPSSMESSPLITIHGKGHVELAINAVTFGINDVVDSVTIDSRLFTCYSSKTNFDTKMTGVYPILKSGNNTIQFGTGVTSVDIDPRWCWLL